MNERFVHHSYTTRSVSYTHLQLFKVAKLLGLENMDNPITIGNNFHSNNMGSKGMIKISDKFFCDEEINRIALIAPNVILNIIRDYDCLLYTSLHVPYRHTRTRILSAAFGQPLPRLPVVLHPWNIPVPGLH